MRWAAARAFFINYVRGTIYLKQRIGHEAATEFPKDPRSERRLGRYEVRSQISAAGMGEVHLAEDTLLLPWRLTNWLRSQGSLRLMRHDERIQAGSAPMPGSEDRGTHFS